MYATVTVCKFAISEESLPYMGFKHRTFCLSSRCRQNACFIDKYMLLNVRSITIPKIKTITF